MRRNSGEIGVSNPEFFIEEVTSEVRRDKLYKYLRRYAWVGVLIVLLIVGGAAFREWSIARDKAAAEAFGDAIISVYELEPSQRVDELRAVQAASGDAKAVARMLAAEEAINAGRLDDAITSLDSILADSDVSEVYRDLAAFKSTLLRSASLAPDEIIRLLEPMAAPGKTFRVLALEQIALANMDAGRYALAAQQLRELSGDAGSPASLRRRVQQILPTLDASGGSSSGSGVGQE